MGKFVPLAMANDSKHAPHHRRRPLLSNTWRTFSGMCSILLPEEENPFSQFPDFNFNHTPAVWKACSVPRKPLTDKLDLLGNQDILSLKLDEAATAMREEIESVDSSSKGMSSSASKKQKRDRLMDAMTKFNDCLSDYIQNKPKEIVKPTPIEVENEFEMALQDRIMEETKDRKNALEAYVYDMRNKLNDKYHDFVTPTEKDLFIARLQDVEDWLYETKSVYVAKLEELKKQGDPIEERYKEHTEHGTVIDQFTYCVNSFKDAVMSNDPKFDHIDASEKLKVLSSCVEAEAWLREKKQQQDALPKYATPVLKSADVKKRAEEVDRLCRPIMTKPKPAPPKPTTPEPQQPQQPQGGEAARSTPTDENNTDAPNAEPMEAEYSETGHGA